MTEQANTPGVPQVQLAQPPDPQTVSPQRNDLPPAQLLPPVQGQWMAPPADSPPPAVKEGDKYAEKIAALEAQLAELAGERQAQLKREQEAAEEAARQKAEEEGKLPDYLAEKEKEISAAKEQIRKERIYAALEHEARTAGIKHPDFIRQIDTSALSVEDGAVRGAREAVTALRERHPELFNISSSTSYSASSPSPSLAGGAPVNVSQQDTPLSEKEKRFARLTGWEAHNMVYREDPRSKPVSFQEAYRGKVRQYNPFTGEGGDR